MTSIVRQCQFEPWLARYDQIVSLVLTSVIRAGVFATEMRVLLVDANTVYECAFPEELAIRLRGRVGVDAGKFILTAGTGDGGEAEKRYDCGDLHYEVFRSMVRFCVCWSLKWRYLEQNRWQRD